MRFLFLLVALLAALQRVAADVPIPYSSCGSPSDLLSIQSATANVWPPIKGQDLTVSVAGSLSAPVNGGNYHLKVSFLGFPVLDRTSSLSDLNVSLPIAAGPFSQSGSIAFPTSIPAGSIDIELSAQETGGAQITCLKLSLTIAQPRAERFRRRHSIPYVSLQNTPVPYTSCSSASAIATLTSVAANVWPPVKGADLTIFAAGSLSKAVNNGTYEVKVSFLGIPVLDQKGSLSELTALPVAAGPVTISKTEPIPSAIPSGKIDLSITATSDTGEQILCIKVSTTIGTPAPKAVALPAPIILRPFKLFQNVVVPYKNCGSSADLLPVTSLTASQWPPVAGSSLTLVTAFNAKETVTGGSYNYKVEFLGIVVSDKTDSLASAGFQLPIAAGPYSITQTLDVPSGLPSGLITNKMSAKDAAGKELYCLVVEFEL